MTTTETTRSGETGHLTTGWDADLDLDDTLLRRYVFALAASNVAPVAAMGGRVLRRDEVIAADRGIPNAVFNAAVLTQPPGQGRPPDEGAFEATLATVEDHYTGGTGRVYLWSPWPTPDLRHRGWVLDGHPPLLVRPPEAPLPPDHEALEIREVHDRRSLDDFTVCSWRASRSTSYNPSNLACGSMNACSTWPTTGCSSDTWTARRSFSGWLLLHGPLGVLVLAATLPEARRRGYWAAMLRRRLHAAEERAVATIFGDMSRPGAQRYGFLPLFRFTLWHRDRRP
ncbi:MAG: GNAT family N-acetyltransferase [Actinomycetota bacterium]|nr:GNAT family N-acetyltransferase [Actinomycetota bacterium]